MNLQADRVVAIAGRSYTLRLGVDGIIALERELNTPFHKLQALFAEGVRLEHVRALLYANLLKHHRLSLEDAGALIEEAGVSAIMAALADPVEQAPAPRPPKATRNHRASQPRGTGAPSSSRGAKRA